MAVHIELIFTLLPSRGNTQVLVELSEINWNSLTSLLHVDQLLS